jgi:predicted 3-demethylubiquinone-9 3-methyltransferase (glyoxalase superfamily)
LATSRRPGGVAPQARIGATSPRDYLGAGLACGRTAERVSGIHTSVTGTMRRVTPHLWFDKEAKEAAEFYTTLLPDSRVTNIVTLHNTPSGDSNGVFFQLAGQPFMAISAGPLFKFNPSVSFHIKCKTVDEVDALWAKLQPGGAVLMELGEYPFSKRYGWLADRYGLSWQIIHAGDQPITQRITPAIMFVGAVCGKAEEAINLYTSVFAAGGGPGESNVGMVVRYGKAAAPDREGTVTYASFELLGQEFGAMDSAREHKFAFNEAVSFLVPCDTQQEIDYLWSKLSADPKAEQCGWLKDRFGLSWQISPVMLENIMRSGDQQKIDRVTQAFLPMKKLDIAELQRAAEG